jgi:hypothetical protein
MGERRGSCNVLVRRPNGKRTLGRPGRRWEDNIKTDLQELAWRDMDWSDMVQDKGQVAGSYECGNGHSAYIK